MEHKNSHNLVISYYFICKYYRVTLKAVYSPLSSSSSPFITYTVKALSVLLVGSKAVNFVYVTRMQR